MKTFFSLSFLLFFSCQASSSWKYYERKIYTSQPATRFLRHLSSDDFSGLELLFIREGSELQLYLNSRLTAFPIWEGDENKSSCLLHIEGGEKRVVGKRAKEGRQLIFPQAAARTIVNALKKGKRVTFSVEEEQLVVGSRGFGAHYKKLLRKR